MKLCLMNRGASTSIISFKVIQECGVEIYESPNQDMMLTDASGQDMNIIGLAKITNNTQSSPDVTAEITCIVTVSSKEILIGPLDQKRLLLLHEDYPNQ